MDRSSNCSFNRRLSLSAIVGLILLVSISSAQTTPSGKPATHSTVLTLEEVQTMPNRGQERDPQAAELFDSKQKADKVSLEGATAEDRNIARQFSEMRSRQLEIVIHNPRQGRIVNGRPAKNFSDPARFQYQVALVLAGYTNALDGQFCGGSLIDSSWVLTAAHCIRDTTQPGDIKVYAGSYQLSQGGRLLGLTKIIRHEQYNGDENHPVNDVALLQLAQPIAGLKTILLANTSKEQQLSSFTTNAIVSGWGDTMFGATGSDDLLFANVGIVQQSVCNDGGHYNGLITDVMICAGSGGADSCQGDSGGPLIMQDQAGNWFQEGIVSWGEGCALPTRPGVYSRVPKFIDWIKQNTQVPK